MELHEHSCCVRKRVYKGTWTPHEDELLKHYMESHGHHRPPWKDVPKYAGLLRCGKSCRFRWLHYLRPTLNHENFTTEEVKVICDMQRTIGNKWAKIVKFLPGRSDNSIKNFWNKHCKKKLINKHNNPISPSIDLHSQPVFNCLENNFSNSSNGENFAGYMNETRVHDHGDCVYDPKKIVNNPPTYMTSIQSSPITNKQILEDEHILFTDNSFTLAMNDQSLPSPFLYTSPPINQHKNLQDDKSSFIYNDLPPLPDSFISQFDNRLLVPPYVIGTKSTYCQSLYNGENLLGWIDPSSSYNDQVPEKHRYHESNHLYELSLFVPRYHHQYDLPLLVPEDPTQLRENPLFGVTRSELSYHNMMI